MPVPTRLLGLLLALPLPQEPLVHLRQTTIPTTAVFAALSEDGDRLWQARGGRIVPIDLELVRRWEAAGVAEPKLGRAVGEAIPFEGSVTALLEAEGRLLVGAGDYGVFALDADGTVTAVDRDAGGRWCFGLALDRERRRLFAVLGARGDNRLRVYDTDTLERRADVPLRLTRSSHLPPTAFSVAVHGDHAYVAAGIAGVARVALEGGLAVELGPDPVPPAARTTLGGALPHRVRDVCVVGSTLYAAAEAGGLLAFELEGDGEWGDASAWTRVPLFGHHPVRVAAITSSSGTELVAVGTAPEPSAAHEWGPYVSWGGFDPRLGPPDVDPSAWAHGCDTALFVFERKAPGVLEEVMWRPTDGGPAERSWKSLALQEVNGDLWVYDNEFTVWRAWRTGGGWSGLRQSADRRYSSRSISYTSGVRSRLDPALVLAGSDAGRRAPLYRLEGSVAEPRLEPLERSDDQKFDLGLLVVGTWISRASGREWFGFGAADDYWRLVEFATSPETPERLTSPFGTWNPSFLAYPADPQFPALTGRSYSLVAVDERGGSELLAMSRTQTPTPVTLYFRSEVEAAAARQRAKWTRPGPDRPLAVAPAGHLAPHPELWPHYREGDMARVHTLNLRFFDWTQDGRTRRVLGIAAGANPLPEGSAAWAGHPKLVFVDLSDCTRPGDPCSAALEDPSAGADPATMSFAYASRPGGLLWDFAVVELGGRPFAIACDTAGGVVAFDLDGLFRGEVLEERSRWSLAPSAIDGTRPPLSAIRVRKESVNGELATVLYLAANRRGVVRVRVDLDDNATPRFEHLGTINTPGQAAGLLLDRFELADGELDALLVFDHEDGGIKLYTE